MGEKVGWVGRAGLEDTRVIVWGPADLHGWSHMFWVKNEDQANKVDICWHNSSTPCCMTQVGNVAMSPVQLGMSSQLGYEPFHKALKTKLEIMLAKIRI